MFDIKSVIDNEYCIGCGVCKYYSNGLIKNEFNKYNQYSAILDASTDHISNILNKICPFSDYSLNEDQISKKLFHDESSYYNKYLGYYHKLYIGHVKLDDNRINCSSGGIITYLLKTLLKDNYVDKIIHVIKDSSNETLFKYGISETEESIISNSKSRYYPVELSNVLEYVSNNQGIYVVVGLPCFIKSVNLLMENDDILKERIKFKIGLVCGHLKSKSFAECISWQNGIKPNELVSIDFRIKGKNSPSNEYYIGVKSNEKNIVKINKSIFGANWGLNFFRYKSCNFCDDIFSETADVVIGDAWLPNYTQDSLGNSILIIRNLFFSNLVKKGIEKNELVLDVTNENDILKSQAGGIRDRKEGLSYRLALYSKKKIQVPLKRVHSNAFKITLYRKLIYRYRLFLQQQSHILWFSAKEKDSYKYFYKKIKKYVILFNLLNKFGSNRFVHKVKKIINSSRFIILKEKK